MSAASQRYRFDGGTAVVTGAASGIGAALAAGLAQRGSHLALVDRDGDALAGVVAALGRAHPQVHVRPYVVDLRDAPATDDALGAVLADHGEQPITLVVNNAGVALGGLFEELSLEDVRWLLDVNLHATIAVTHRLLPTLLATPGSHLANLSSVFGIIAPPGQSAYSTSKFAVRGFTEALRAELAGRVGVTCVHPGGIATNIARDARAGAHVPPARAGAEAAAFQRLLSIPAADAAAAILRGVERRRARVLIGTSAVVPDVLARLSPSHHQGLVTLVTRRGLRRRS